MQEVEKTSEHRICSRGLQKTFVQKNPCWDPQQLHGGLGGHQSHFETAKKSKHLILLVILHQVACHRLSIHVCKRDAYAKYALFRTPPPHQLITQEDPSPPTTSRDSPGASNCHASANYPPVWSTVIRFQCTEAKIRFAPCTAKVRPSNLLRAGIT